MPASPFFFIDSWLNEACKLIAQQAYLKLADVLLISWPRKWGDCVIPFIIKQPLLCLLS